MASYPKPSYDDDDLTPSEPPPSYAEALNSAPVLPGRPLHPPPLQQNTPASVPPPTPQRPGSGYQSPTSAPQNPQNSQNSHQNNPGTGSAGLYSNNPNLPFRYPRGHYCRKCQNTGYKLKNGKVCHDCWNSLFLNKHAYNPNPALAFQYPRGFLCEKCMNTGTKRRNGLSCQDCYARFAPRNNYSVAPSFNGFAFLDIIRPNYGASGPSPNAIRVPPGDPRLGGVLCGNCRGRGQVMFFLDTELCLVCGGLGRLLNSRPPQQSGPYR